MFNHAPNNYQCPICVGIKGIETDDILPKIQSLQDKVKPSVLMKQADFIYRDDLVSAFINSF